MADDDIDDEFRTVADLWERVRTTAVGDLSKKRAFKEFIKRRNNFLDAVTRLNASLYAEKHALLFPQLLDDDDHWLIDGDMVTITLIVAADDPANAFDVVARHMDGLPASTGVDLVQARLGTE